MLYPNSSIASAWSWDQKFSPGLGFDLKHVASFNTAYRYLKSYLVQDTVRRDDMPPPIEADLRPCADGSAVRTALVVWPRHCAPSWPRWDWQTDGRIAKCPPPRTAGGIISVCKNSLCCNSVRQQSYRTDITVTARYFNTNTNTMYFCQWRSQKFSTVAFLSVHSRSAAIPSRPYNKENLMTYYTTWMIERTMINS